MELGDLQYLSLVYKSKKKVAILAIMELGDLPILAAKYNNTIVGRNPRYNGIG